MKAFRFRGARILEWRRVQADAARLAFVRATESVREAAAAIDQADADCARAVREFVDATASPVDVGTHLRYRNWIDRQRAHVAACREEHQKRRVAAEQAATALRDATRQVKVMERLRERAWERYTELERRADLKEIDQLAASKFARLGTEKEAEREH
jgi:flagellar export protein FliJ